MTTPTESPHQHMNTVIHDSLRRDLDRVSRVLEAPLSDQQRAALCQHITWMLDYLHHHHVGEDDGVWPLTLAKRPDLQQLVDEMEAEHQALASASDRLRAASDAFAEDGSDAARQALASAVADMQATTLPHLEHEEKVAMPLVLETLDDSDWKNLEKNYFRKGISLPDSATMFMWLLDDLDDRRAAIVKTQAPAPLFWVLSRIAGPRYDRDATRRWGELAGVRA